MTISDPLLPPPDPDPSDPDSADPDSAAIRDPDAPGGVGTDDVNDVLPLPHEPSEGGLSGDDLNGEAPD